jgi:hypothetical protein
VACVEDVFSNFSKYLMRMEKSKESPRQKYQGGEKRFSVPIDHDAEDKYGKNVNFVSG